MIDPYLIWTPILVLPVVGLLRFLGCAFQTGGLGVGGSTLTIEGPEILGEGAENVPYPSNQFIASGGTPPYLWSIAPPAPAGLSIDQTGILGGLPASGFAGKVTVTVTDSANPPAQASATSLTLNVLGIDQTSLSPGQVNLPYAATLTATGGFPPITWSATGLPPGLGIDASGNITGKPSMGGAFTPAITAADASVSATVKLPLTVAAVFPVFNTGVDGTGNLLGDGAVDPHYTMILSADPAFPGPNALVADAGSLPMGWVNGAASKWIAPQANALLNNAVGDYKYQITFDLTGFDPATASITGTSWSDNAAFYSLNGGAEQPISTSSTAFPFTIPVGSGFIAGQNTLVFRVNNAGAAVNPTGMRLELTGTAVTA